MKKKILFFLALVCTVWAVYANPVTPERARRVATNFAYSQNLKMLLQYDLTDVTQQTHFNHFYIFTGGDASGFVLVSKDDCVIPILGYSETTPFLTKEMPEHLVAWFQDYDNQIQFYLDREVKPSDEVLAKWAMLEQTGAKTSGHVAPSVEPLLTTTWHQWSGSNALLTYNKYCPMVGNEHCVTGCVATAMAQVMKYWNWPRQGRGTKSYEWTPDVVLSSNFSDTTFDWEHMPNALTSTSSDAEINAVASLMYNVGIAVSMQYGVGGSGAISASSASNYAESHATIDVALRNYFHYKYTTNAIFSNGFSDSEWKNVLKMELNAGRPILYSGSSQSGGGHAFVLDGYSDQGTFHVNWGWGGLADGYYAIGLLRPEDSGTGASSSNTYDYDNDAIIGIEPVATIAPEDGTTLVTAIPDDPSHGTVSGSGTYTNFDDMITLNATPATGYTFKCWSDGNRYNPRILRATGGNQTYTAYFTQTSSMYRECYNANNPGYCYYNQSSSITEWGINLPYDRVSLFDYLDKVVFFAGVGTYTVRVYVGGSTPVDANFQFSTTVTLTSDRWDSVTLPTPVDIQPNQPVWITMGRTGNDKIAVDCASGISGGFWGKTRAGWENYTDVLPLLIRGHFGFSDGSPEAPTSIVVSDVSSSGATVSWTMPSSTLTPSSYDVAYGVGLIPEMLDIVNSTTNSVVLSGLRNDTYYNVFVRAKYRNDAVASQWIMSSFRTHDASITNPVVVTAVANEDAWGTVTGSGTYQQGTSVTLEATPMPGYQFSRWSDNATTSSTRTVTATTDVSYTAIFSPCVFTVTAAANDANFGTVTIEGEPINNNTYPYLSTLCLTATPSSGYTFKYWHDGNMTNPRFVTVTSDVDYTAIFESTDSKVTLTSHEHEVSVTVVETAPVVIYDMLGRCVYSGQATTGLQHRVTLPTAGVYLVKVGNFYAQKVVVR